MPGIVTRLGEYSLEWFQLRGKGATLVTTDDTALDLEAGKAGWDNKPALPTEEPKGVFDCVPARAVNVPYMSAGKIRTVQIIGYGTNLGNETCDWILYGYRGLNSPILRIADGTAILGDTDCVKDPVTNSAITAGFYVDTWGKSNDYWTSVAELDGGDNTISTLSFALRGLQYLYMEIDIPSALQVASFGAAFSGY